MNNADENQAAKAKTHKKTFHVGGSSRHATRVPSYGKKLNKLTALTTNVVSEKQPPSGQMPTSILRSSSQNHLSEVRSTKRNVSAQDLRRLRRSSSNTGERAHGLKPLSTMAVASDESGTEKHSSATKSAGKPTFVTGDDEDDEDEPSSMVNDVPLLMRKQREESKSREKFEPSRLNAGAIETGSYNYTRTPEQTTAGPDTSEPPEPLKTGKVSPPAVGPVVRPRDYSLAESLRAKDRDRTPSRFLIQSVTKIAQPQLSTESAVSKDIESKKRDPPVGSARANVASPELNSGEKTPINNSQPMTSRFLESPRKPNVMPKLPNNTEGLPPLSQRSQSMVSLAMHQSASTTNLGVVSRTQQKLLLQRASSIYDFEAHANTIQESSAVQHAKMTREIERIAREYRNVRRFRDPIGDSAKRLFGRGVPPNHVALLKRTNTQTTLHTLNDHPSKPITRSAASHIALPKAAQSQKPVVQIMDLSTRELLLQLWHSDDYRQQVN